MRRVGLLLMIAWLAASVHAQESTDVKLVSPVGTIAVTITDVDVIKLRVAYTAPAATTITITDVGPLVAGTHIAFAKQRDPRNYTFDLWVDGSALNAGETHSGSVLFRPPGAAAGVIVPVTVTRIAPAFTAAATPTDICLSCGEPRVISVQITNTGKVPLTKIKVGTVVMSDASRGHRWILPRSAASNCGLQPAQAAGKGEDGKIVIRPCSEGKVDIPPGDSRKISVAIEPPQRAGDYATTIELTADGAPTASPSMVLHVRGPGGASAWPPILFVLTVLAGWGIAHALEWLFGSGGRAKRTEALISSRATRDELEIIRTWAETRGLKTTLGRIASDISEIDAAVRDGDRRSPEELEAEATEKFTTLQKRRRLKFRVEFADNRGLKDRVPSLDAEPDSGTVEAYDTRLEAILAPSVRETTGAVSAQEKADRDAEREELIRARRWMNFFRAAVLALVSLITAYGAFYANGCNFGSIANYITVFLWALGLTQAGRGLTGEIAAPPAQSRTAAPAARAEG